MSSLAVLLPTLLAATLDVAPGADLRATVASARPGDTVRLAAGTHAGTLGRIRSGVHVVGAGVGVTVIRAPEGEDGAVVEAGGELRLEALTLQASGPRSAIRVLGGEVRASGVSLVGGAVGAFVGGGRLLIADADLSGEYGVLLQSGELTLEGSRVRGKRAGVAQIGGAARLGRVVVTGPASEAGVTISGGTASLADVVLRTPGPSGLSVLGRARVEARAIDVSGALPDGGILGDCVQVSRGTLVLEGATLTRCGGAALEAFGGSIEVRGVDATGGEAGCLVFLDRASGRLQGNLCTRRGPAVVAASGAQVTASMNRWSTDPVLWVECGTGARIHLGPGERTREPCGNSGSSLDKPLRK